MYEEHKPFKWDEENIAALKKYWQEGKPAGEIARLLPGTTRSGILGKIQRLRIKYPTMGLQNREIPKELQENKLKGPQKKFNPFQNADLEKRGQENSHRRTQRQILLDKAGPFTETENKLHMQDLEKHHCRYPYGDKLPYTFCGQPKCEHSKAYCAYHRAITIVIPRKINT